MEEERWRMKLKPMTEMIETQMWKVGDLVAANDTDFNITENKVYQILRRGTLYDCFFIINDLGEEEEYTQEYFKRVIEE